MKRRRGPGRASPDGFVVELDPDESALVLRLLDELRALLTDENPSDEARVLMVRLFPVAHPDDEDAEAEYQRWMRDELVQSKLAAFDLVQEMLTDESGVAVDEGRLIAFMQSVNSIRLVLGTMLGVTDDPDIAEVDEGFEDSPEYHLYAFLSWLLEHTVRALWDA